MIANVHATRAQRATSRLLGDAVDETSTFCESSIVTYQPAFTMSQSHPQIMGTAMASSEAQFFEVLHNPVLTACCQELPKRSHEKPTSRPKLIQLRMSTRAES